MPKVKPKVRISLTSACYASNTAYDHALNFNLRSKFSMLLVLAKINARFKETKQTGSVLHKKSLDRKELPLLHALNEPTTFMLSAGKVLS